MKLYELIMTAWRSLIVNPRRSLLTMVGIVIGIASVITILSLGNGIEAQTLKNLQTTKTGKQTTTIDFFTSNPSKVTSGFDQADIDLLVDQSDLGLDKVTIPQEPDDPFSTDVLVNDSQHQLSVSLNHANGSLTTGKRLTTQDSGLKNQVAMVSKSFAKSYFRSAANAIQNAISIDGYSYQIIGVVGSKNGIDIYLPKQTYLANRHTMGGNKLKLTFARGVDVAKQTTKAVKLLQKSGSQRANGDYSYFDTGSLLDGIRKVIQALTYFISAIAGISLFIAGIGVMNMMYISVSERTKEIGIRLAIGATPRLIMWQFLLESIMLTAGGGVIGFLIGYGTASAISLLLPFKAIVTFNTFLVAFTVSTLVGLLSGLLPAMQAAKKNLIDILR